MSAPKRSEIEKVSIKAGKGDLRRKNQWEVLKEKDNKAQKKIRDRGPF